MQFQQEIKDVWHTAMPNPQLAETFVRFQEHYENPQFRGRIFTLEEFRASNGKFDYFTEIDGFNIPSTALTPFKQGQFDPLSTLEKQLLDATQDLKGKFYLIGTNGKQATLKHELAHGLYFTNPEYRKEVDAVVRATNTTEMTYFLHATRLYHEAVFQDEIQAYLASDLRWMAANGVNTKALNDAKREIRKIFRKYHDAAREALAI